MGELSRSHTADIADTRFAAAIREAGRLAVRAMKPMERPLLAQSGHSYANSTSRLIRNKRPYQLGIRLGGGGATALTFRLAIRTANALLREKP